MKELLMKGDMAMILAKVAYAKVFRELIVEKIDDPDSDIDKMAIKMFDVIFEYNDAVLIKKE